MNNLEYLKNNSYPGRGIVTGLSQDSAQMIVLYWIMGRSENSRNRIFTLDGDTVRTEPFDASKVEDPSLIIYNVSRKIGLIHIVTNGDQTDTIYDELSSGGSFESALMKRCYEPDGPNYTPRISCVINEKTGNYSLSGLRRISANNEGSLRSFYHYQKGTPGTGHCIHTYLSDGNPLPSFNTEPVELPLAGTLDEIVNKYWDALNKDNRVSILAKSISLKDGLVNTVIINRHKR